jgi:hypothetical protein
MPRVQFELNEQTLDYLDKLQADLQATTRGEVLRHAIAVLRWSADKIRDGYQILAMKEGENIAKELSNPLLDQVARKEKQAVERVAEQR